MLDDCKADKIEEAGGDNVEKQQEMLLINKMTQQGKTPPKSQSSFLQKKLQQRKFFDSGDYAMNQDKEKKHARPTGIPAALGGGFKKPELPANLRSQAAAAAAGPSAPPAVSTAAKTPLSPQGSGSGGPPAAAVSPVAAPTTTGTGSPSSGDEQEEHLQIPRPDTVPQRKASILHPSAHSKLSPQPLIHHHEHNDELLSSPQN